MKSKRTNNQGMKINPKIGPTGGQDMCCKAISGSIMRISKKIGLRLHVANKALENKAPTRSGKSVTGKYLVQACELGAWDAWRRGREMECKGWLNKLERMYDWALSQAEGDDKDMMRSECRQILDKFAELGIQAKVKTVIPDMKMTIEIGGRQYEAGVYRT